MTKSKGQKLLQELIVKYGDVVVGKTYDYWATRLDEYRNTIDIPQELVLTELHLSDMPWVTNWSEYKDLIALCEGKIKPGNVPVEIKESKAKYDSPEETLLRKKREQEFNQLFGTFGRLFQSSPVAETINTYSQLNKWLNTSPSPKEYGMYLSKK